MTAAVAKPDSPAAVSRFEFNLLRLLKFALGHFPPEQATRLLQAKASPPPCLSPACVRIAEDTLAKGCILHLVKSGGWRIDRFLRSGRPLTGRIWERVPLTERTLEFSRNPLAFLAWLTGEKVTDARDNWDAPAHALTGADELFFALAFENLKLEPNVSAVLIHKRVFRGNALCWLLGPGDFAAAEGDPPSFEPWMTGVRSAILECLQPLLAKRWIRAERNRGQIGDWGQMRRQGTNENRTLTDYLAACEKSGRTDLGRFALDASRAIMKQPDLAASYWTGGLQAQAPARLAERLDTQRAAVVLPRHLATLQRWDRAARAVGYFEDDYAASQLWKEEWEAANGEGMVTTAARILAELEPLRT